MGVACVIRSNRSDSSTSTLENADGPVSMELCGRGSKAYVEVGVC